MDLPLDIIEGAGPRPTDEPNVARATGANAAGNLSLQVYFRCSNQYVRVVRGDACKGGVARCPKCGKSMRFVVGEGGTERRFFELSC